MHKYDIEFDYVYHSKPTLEVYGDLRVVHLKFYNGEIGDWKSFTVSEISYMGGYPLYRIVSNTTVAAKKACKKWIKLNNEKLENYYSFVNEFLQGATNLVKGSLIDVPLREAIPEGVLINNGLLHPDRLLLQPNPDKHDYYIGWNDYWTRSVEGITSED
jgi:hypothetical protein